MEKNMDISSNPVRDRNEEIRKQMIMMVTRQTSYSYDEAEEKLKENNYNYDVVIKEFMGIKPKEELKSNTKNQEVYRQIRNMLDDGDKQYRQRKEMQEKMELVAAYREQMRRRQMGSSK